MRVTHLALPALLSPIVVAQTWPADLVGTWSTKSNQTLTGPGFYDPQNEQMFEPSHTGISYSFTNDGYYEEAYYRAIANPQNPACPGGIMQWQHGSFVMQPNGSLLLTPISVDGRQLLSEPCQYSDSIFTRWNVSELFQRYSVYTDPFHNIPRLDLYKFDGSPMNPMYLAMSPPEMLPTTTLNPTSTAASGSQSTAKSKAKRALDAELPAAWRSISTSHDTAQVVHRIDSDRLWWVGVAMTGIGGLLYVGPRRFGIKR